MIALLNSVWLSQVVSRENHLTGSVMVESSVVYVEEVVLMAATL